MGMGLWGCDLAAGGGGWVHGHGAVGMGLGCRGVGAAAKLVPERLKLLK